MINPLISTIKGLINGVSLKARVVRGSLWLGLGGSFEYGLRFLRNIILARLLTPEAFGVMAIILAVNAALESFTQLGVKEAIIQSPTGQDETYLNSAWWLSFIRSILLFSVAAMSVPVIITFYDVTQFKELFQVSFLSLLFNGALSVRAYSEQKKVAFKKWVIISSGGGAIGVLTAIVLTFWIQSVWALVIGFVFEAAARCFLSFLICPFLPRLQFRSEHTRALLKFSRGMFGLPLLFFVFTQADTVVIGKV